MISIHLPTSFPNAENRSRKVAELCESWLADQRPLGHVPTMPASARVSVSIPASLLARVKAAIPGMTPNKAVTAVLFTMLQPVHEKPIAPGTSFVDGRVMGVDQEAYFQAVRTGLSACDSGAIVLAEGGTGLGKSLVIATLAQEGMNNGCRCLVTAPTIQVVGQIRKEFCRITPDIPEPSIYLGRSQFVSCAKLLVWLDDEDGRDCPDLDVIRAWLLHGGLAAKMGRSSHAANLLPNIPYLVEELRELAPSAPVDQFALSGQDEAADDPGAASYESLRSRLLDTEKDEGNKAPVFATHAAVIWNARNLHAHKKAFLPSVDRLLIDEAHMFHEIAEAAFSQSLAFRSLAWALGEPTWKERRAATSAKQAAVVVKKVMRAIQEAPALAGSGAVRMNRDMMRETGIDVWCKELQETLKRLPSGHDVVDSALALLGCALAGNCDVTLHLSAKHRYPSMTAGPRSLAFFFDPFWKTARSAALFSGTIYLPKADGGYTASMLSLPLSLPGDRIVMLPPVHPSWSRRMDLIVVSPDRADLVPPPEEKDGEVTKEAAWHSAVAKEVAAYSSTAKGGMVCLLSGYRHIEGIGAHLVALCEGVVIVQQRRGGFRSAMRAFLQARQEGKPAIWLAAGPAWVGMDITDTCAPEDDWLFTDLVIPRIPFGTVHSSAHKNRMTWMNSAERDRAAMQFRQGVGRLMRRPGLKNRRLIMLDGRIHDPAKLWLMRPIKLILEKLGIQV